MTDVELWCEGLRFCGRRRLQESETRALDLRIAKTLSRLALLDRFMAGGLLLLLILTLAGFVWGGSPNMDNKTAILSPVATFVLGLGCIGTLLEVTFAPQTSTRLIFAVAFIIAALGLVFGAETQSQVLEGLLTLTVMIVVLGGSAIMILRWRDRRRLRVILQRATEDSRVGEVMQFGSDESDQRRRIEMLPTSHLAYLFAPAPVSWRVLYVTPVSRTPHSFEAPVIGHAGEHVSSGGLLYNQRHMSSEEVRELTRIRKRSIRKGIVSTIGITYVCGVLFTAFGDRSTAVRLLAALALGGMYLQKQWRVWRNLRIDVAGGMILVVRPQEELEPSPSLAEVLPASHFEWTTKGNPSRWRVAKW